MERQLYTIETSFNATHSMGDESKKHAHTFIVKLILERKGEKFKPFTDYEVAVDGELEKYRGKYLNGLECFKDRQPTLERLCLTLYEQLKAFFDREGYYGLLRLECGDNPTRLLSVGEKIYISAVNRFCGD